MRSYALTGGKGRVCFSFDDYHPLNIRLEEILHKQGIEATFFIETQERAARDQILELHKRGHDIGGHTIHHPGDIKALNGPEMMGEIEGCKKMIENITDRPCEIFAYPRGRHNEQVVETVKRAGFKEARTTHVLKTSVEDPYRMPTTVHLLDTRKEYAGRDCDQILDFYLQHVVKNGGMLSIWGHAWEIERGDMWGRFENIVVKLGKTMEA